MFRFTLLFATITLFCWQCQQPVPAKAVVEASNMTQPRTHKEAADSLRADTTQPLKPLLYKTLAANEMNAVLEKIDLPKLMIKTYPDHGFYGDDHYHIEFFFMGMSARSADDMVHYDVRGKNRFKKTITPFSGSMQVTEIAELTDPNLNKGEIEAMNVQKVYALKGKFNIAEDSTLSSSGRFAGDFTMECSIAQDTLVDFWFFSEQSPSQRSGYRFTGNWINYRKPSMTKPVVWSLDIFAFGNSILKDFSYGERDVEINPEYRNLGWDNFWDGEEWWYDSPRDQKADNNAK